MKLRFQTTVALLSLAAWPAAAQPAPPAPSTLETLGAMHQTGSTADWPEVPQTGQKADQVKQNLTKIKLAARLPYLAVCSGTGCSPHCGWPAGRRDFRGHAQIKSLGGDRPLSRRRGRRGKGVRTDLAEEDTQRRMLLEGRLPVHRRAKSGAGISGGRVLL